MALKLENNIGSKFNLTHADNAGEISLTSKDLTSTAYSVETIEDLATVPVEFSTVVVKDLDRGGIFIYDSTKVAESNNGTNFNGWIRQYSGAVNVKWFGAKGDGVTDDTSSLLAADNVSTIVLFPGNGTYCVSNHTPTNYVYTNENASLEINGSVFKLSTIPAVVSPLEQIEIDGTTVRMSNLTVGIDSAKSLRSNSNSYANTSFGTSALENAVEVIRATAIGPYSLNDAIDLYSMTAVGTNAGQYTSYGNRCTLIGDNAGKNLGNAVVAERHHFFLSSDPDPNGWDTRYPEWRAYVGSVSEPNFIAVDLSSASNCVAVGRNALGYSITAKNTVAVGYDAGTSSINGSSNTFVGDRSGQWTIKGDNAVFIGAESGRALMDCSQDVLIGKSAGHNYVKMSQNVAVGYQSLSGLQCNLTDKPLNNVSIGRIAMANSIGSIQNNVAVGGSSLLVNSGNGNTAVGQNSMLRKRSGDNNTAIGQNSLIVMADGATDATEFTNCTGVGFNARVSGNNQVQLGDANTTTYVYGTVQNRSDLRDKADVQDTKLGLEFIRGLRPVDYRWDMRDNYVELYEEQVGTEEDGTPILETFTRKLQRDGSKKGTRFHHGLIAQEVKELCDCLGVDFGGYQDHSIKGGSDVLSLGYDELIAPIIKALQEISSMQDSIEERLSIMELKSSIKELDEANK